MNPHAARPVRTTLPLYSQDAVTKNVLLFDGLSRAGKTLVGTLVSEFPRLEFVQLADVVDYIPTLWHFGLIDDQAAPAFLRMTVDSYTYQRIIGRNLNTRKADAITSVYRSVKAEAILQRASGDEGWEPVERFNHEGRVTCYITHETLPHQDLWFRAFPELRIVLSVRHPVDVCYSWHSRGLGSRLGTDPLAFTPVADIGGKPVPIFALDCPDEYQRATPLNRIVLCVLAMQRMYDRALASLSKDRARRVQTVAFEHMATNPMAELRRLADWLDTTLHPDMAAALAREGVPRTIEPAEQRRRLDVLAGEVEPALIDQLLETVAVYERRWGLPSVAA